MKEFLSLKKKKMGHDGLLRDIQVNHVVVFFFQLTGVSVTLNTLVSGFIIIFLNVFSCFSFIDFFSQIKLILFLHKMFLGDYIHYALLASSWAA